MAKFNREYFVENIVATLAVTIFFLVIAGSIVYKTKEIKIEKNTQSSPSLSISSQIKEQSIKANSVSDDQIEALYQQKRQKIAEKKRQEQAELAAAKRKIEEEKKALIKKQEAKEKEINKKQKELKKQQKIQNRKILEEKQRIEKEKKIHQKKLKEEKEEQQKALAKEKAKFERQKKIEAEKKAAEKKRKQAEEKKKQAEELKKIEAEKKRIKASELKRKAEAARKRAEKQAILDGLGSSLADDISEREEELKQKAIQKYGSLISEKVRSNWTRPSGLPSDLTLRMSIRLDNAGNVKGIPKIIKSSGYPAFDNSAVEAARLASPLPLPEKVKWAKVFTKNALKLNFP